MAVAANKRSVMTLFSGANDMFSHQVRIVLAEKGVSVDICQVDPSNLPDELADAHYYVPTDHGNEGQIRERLAVIDGLLGRGER